MIHLPRPSVRVQLALTGGMQLVLVAMVAYGLVTGHPKAISNGVLALAITFVPAVLERNYALPLDPWLGLWITTAVFLHTLGSAGFYAGIGWWDHLTHATSASLVAGVGYTAARAIDVHSDVITIPSRFAFAYILIFVLAFGVIWELFEFALDLTAARTGIIPPLSQHGLDDTVRDLIFNSLGAVLVAAFGQAHLYGTASAVSERFLSTE